jgi:hypothetical protein
VIVTYSSESRPDHHVGAIVEWGEDRSDLRCVMLTISIELNGTSVTPFDCEAEAGSKRAADTKVEGKAKTQSAACFSEIASVVR